jgi:hypothetical protein
LTQTGNHIVHKFICHLRKARAKKEEEEVVVRIVVVVVVVVGGGGAGGAGGGGEEDNRKKKSKNLTGAYSDTSFADKMKKGVAEPQKHVAQV